MAIGYCLLLVLWGTSATFVTRGDRAGTRETLVEYAPIGGALLLAVPLLLSFAVWRMNPSSGGHRLAVLLSVITWIWVIAALPLYGLGALWVPLAVAYTGIAVRTSKRRLAQPPRQSPNHESAPRPGTSHT